MTDLRKTLGEVKTSLYLPRKVWEAAKIRATRDGVTLRDVVLAALTAYLKPPTKGARS